MSCMKCGKKVNQSNVFCDECLEKMEQCPIPTEAVVNLPKRPSKPATKKRSFRQRYFWEAEEKIEVLRTRVRWLTFVWSITFLCLVACVALIVWMLYMQDQLPAPISDLFRG